MKKIIYITIWISLFILSFLEVLKIKVNIIFLKLSLIILFLLTGFRYYNGTDYESYKNIFMDLDKQSYRYLEPLFREVVIQSKKIISYEYLFLVMSGISFLLLYLIIKSLEEYKFLSLLIYVSVFWLAYDFNGIRQAIAMNSFLFFVIIYKENKIKGLLAILISIGFHYSSLIIYLVYLFRKIKNIISKRIILYFVGCIFFSNILVTILLRYSDKLVFYTKVFKENLAIISIIQRVILISFILLFSKKLIEKDKKSEELINLYCIGFLIYGLFYRQGVFSTRINMFFRILEIILIPLIIKDIKIARNRITVFFILILIYSSIYIKQVSNKDISPYKLNYNLFNNLKF